MQGTAPAAHRASRQLQNFPEFNRCPANVRWGSKAPLWKAVDHFRSSPINRQFQSRSLLRVRAGSRTRVLCLRAQLVDRQRTLPLQWSGFQQRPWRVAIFEALTANCGKDASKWKLSAPRFNRSTSLLMGPITACRPWGRLSSSIGPLWATARFLEQGKHGTSQRTLT